MTVTVHLSCAREKQEYVIQIFINFDMNNGFHARS
jgi:hypothetical protein